MCIVSEMLKEARKEAHMTQEQLAVKAGTKKSYTLKYYETTTFEIVFSGKVSGKVNDNFVYYLIKNKIVPEYSNYVLNKINAKNETL